MNLKTINEMKPLEAIAISLNAALYAAFGYLTYLGVFTPVIGVVRFWPAVIIPAVFATLFGPFVGGAGAAIGIFISDMMVHGNALLSITVGIPSNFIGFYLVGYIARKKIGLFSIMLGCLTGCFAAVFSVWLFWIGRLDFTTFVLFTVTCLASVGLALAIGFAWPDWRSYGIGSIVGLGIGSAIIGVGLWLFSQLFLLPSGESQVPLYFSVIWFIWTFGTEIPFLVFAGPPILKACFLAFPSFKSKPKE
jgi:uncharacterized membrane protein